MVADTFNMRDLRQWLCWRSEERDGKPTKVPYSPATGKRADSTVPETWTGYQEAVRACKEKGYGGIGFVFTSGDDLCGVDLDRCLNPEIGEMESLAQEIIEALDSYTEVSPSGTGVHVLLRGELPPGRRRSGRIEMYDRARFFTITGHRLQDVPATINRRQEELTRLHRRVFGLEQPTRAMKPDGRAAAGMVLADSELIDHAMRAANGEKFARLWAGDTSEYATATNEGRSEADLALCSILSFWCGPDEDRIDRLFRQSGLMRQKWERSDYRSLTLAVALDRDEFYEGGAALTLGKTYACRRGVVSIG